MGILYESGQWGIWIFAALSIIIGGAASLAAGRALALTWQPIRKCLLYALPISLTIAFLHYALFEESVISLVELRDAVLAIPSSPLDGARGLAFALRGIFALFILQAIFVLVGYRLTRVRQMVRQYSFECAPAGPFGWLRKPDVTKISAHPGTHKA